VVAAFKDRRLPVRAELVLGVLRLFQDWACQMRCRYGGAGPGPAGNARRPGPRSAGPGPRRCGRRADGGAAGMRPGDPAGLLVAGQLDARGGDGPAGPQPARPSRPGGWRRSARHALGGCSFVPVPAAVQELGHRPGQYPGAGIAAGLGGQADTAEQNLVLCFEPGQRLLLASQVLGCDAGAG
jgi:hypothetical protein